MIFTINRLFYRGKSKWDTFSYNYRWSDYVSLFDGWIARCSMAVPIIGYLILFNDSISQHLSFNNLANENLVWFGLSSILRLKLIYFGLIFLGAANIIYRWRRPFVFKIGTNRFDYVEKALEHFTVSAYIDIHGTIRHQGHHTLHGKYDDAEYDAFLDLAVGEGPAGAARDVNWAAAKSRYEGLLRAMLIENFARNDVKRRFSLSCCLALSLTGYLLLAIPSADLLIKVVSVSLK
jgi:hypothetical protein